MEYRGFTIEKVKPTAATAWEPLWRLRGSVDGMRHIAYDALTKQEAKDHIDKIHDEYLDK